MFINTVNGLYAKAIANAERNSIKILQAKKIAKEYVINESYSA